MTLILQGVASVSSMYMNSLSWLHPAQLAQADQKSGEEQELLPFNDVARQNGDGASSDAAVLERNNDVDATAAADHADSSADPGNRRMSPFAWLLLAAAVRPYLPLSMRRETKLSHVQFLLPAGIMDQLMLEGVAWRAATACHGELVPLGIHNQQQRPLSTAHGQPRLW